VTADTKGKYSDVEALKMAEGMEREGIAFYQSASEAVTQQELADTFSMLKGEEVKHLQLFEDMSGQLARSKTEEYWDEPDVDAYIQAIVSKQVFPKPDLAAGTVAGMSTAADALRFALQAEKNTTLFYSLCAEKAKGAEVRKAFYDLVAEEKKHIVLVSRLLQQASA